MAMYEITSAPAPLDFECTMLSNMVERTIRNAKNLITLRQGEVPFDRQRGLNPAIFDLPYDEAEGLIVQELDRCLLWEPDAEVVEGWIELDEDGESIVHCVIEIAFENAG